MNRGLYAAATGMIQQKERLNIISNNISNINTTGFKKDQAVTRSFQEELLYCTSNKLSNKLIGTYNHGAYIDKVVTSFDQGSTEYTGRDLDLALEGSGFFVLQTENGIAYTRDGAFTVDSDGYLVTTDGYKVLGQDGLIQLKSDCRIDENGYVYTQGTYTRDDGTVAAGEVFVDRLRLVGFEDTTLLEKAGDNLFTNAGGTNINSFKGLVKQGYLETANVSALTELVNLMTTSSNYESNQRIIGMIDGTLDKTVNDVGRV